jgi:8-oxo-dGTP pyrophosphatase MutT (NUDIX family)
MAAVGELADPFARAGLTVPRGTGIRLGELLDLELDCIWDSASHGSWLKVPLGKLSTERTVPLDEPTVAALDEWMTRRGPQRALPHPRLNRPAGFLFTERGQGRVHERKFLLPGGKCDSEDSGWAATLLRECAEESQVRVVPDSVAYPGHQVVTGDPQAPGSYAQVRLFGAIEAFGPPAEHSDESDHPVRGFSITCRVGGRVAADAGFCSPLVTSLWVWSVVCHFRRDDASVAAVRQVPAMRSVSATASPHAGQSPPGPMRLQGRLQSSHHWRPVCRWPHSPHS